MSRPDPLHAVSDGDRWLVVVAHPDDETFGCGSVIAHAARLGARVTVICATRGEAGERTDRVPDGADLGDARESELRTAAALLGATEVELLGHRDSGFEGPLPAGALCAVPVADLADEINRHLDRSVRVAVTIDGSDGHRDHVHVRDALRRAVAALPDDERPQHYEVGLPNSLMRRWAAEMAARAPDSPYLEIDLDALGTPDANVTDVLDTPDLFDLRVTAIGAHASQASPFDHVSPALRREFLGATALVHMAPAAPADPPGRAID